MTKATGTASLLRFIARHFVALDRSRLLSKWEAFSILKELIEGDLVEVVAKYDSDELRIALNKILELRIHEEEDDLWDTKEDLYDAASKSFIRNRYEHTVNSLLLYISDIAKEIVAGDHRIMMSAETMKYEDILKFSSMDALISHMVDDKLERLSQAGFSELSSFLEKKIKIPIVSSADDRLALSMMLEIRNVLTHNDGVASKAFIRRLDLPEVLLGNYIHISKEDASDAEKFSLKVAFHIDRTAREKYALKPYHESQTDVTVIEASTIKMMLRNNTGTH